MSPEGRMDDLLDTLQERAKELMERFYSLHCTHQQRTATYLAVEREHAAKQKLAEAQATIALLEKLLKQSDVNYEIYEMTKLERDQLQAAVTAQQEHIKNRDIMLKTQGEQAAIAVKEYAEEIGRLRRTLADAPYGHRGETHGDIVARYYSWFANERQQALASEKEAS